MSMHLTKNIWYHSQKLRPFHWRGWLHFGTGHNRTFGWEARFGSKSCGFGLHKDDDFTLNICIPLVVAFYFSFPSFGRWRSGQFGIDVHDWAIWFHPWANLWEWNRKQPWWRQTYAFHIKDFLLGKQRCEKTTIREDIPACIHMPEGNYHGKAQFEVYSFKRPRWFGWKRLSTWIEVPKGIPHSGKGENSWDCGDDGIWATGCEGHDIEKAEENFRQAVMRNRKKYGYASEKAVSEALVACGSPIEPVPGPVP